MIRLFHFFACLLILSICSCNQSNDDKIITAFKEYAEKNLDNPDAIVEIIGIDSVDTFSTKQIKDDLTKIYNTYLSANQMERKATETFIKFANDPNKTSKLIKVELNRDKIYKSLMFKYFSLSEKKVTLANESYEKSMQGDSLNVYLIDSEYKGILNKKDTIFIGRKLSYRSKENGIVKLCKIDVISDTLNTSFYFNSKAPNEYAELMSDFHYFTEKYKRDFEIDIEIINTLKSLFNIFKEKYNVEVDFEP